MLFELVAHFYLQWGILGAAVASGISRCTTSVIGYRLLIQQISPNWKERGLISSILRIGTPAALGTMSFAMVYWGFFDGLSLLWDQKQMLHWE